jgi:hypothetical protein
MKIITLVAVLVVSGCATLSNLDKGYSLDSRSTKSIMIFGVKPNYRFGVEEGMLVNTQFKWDAGATPILAVYPKSGYVIAVMNKTSSNQIYALTSLKTSTFSYYYHACNDSPVDTFTIEPGKIIYLGDFHFSGPPDPFKHTITYDPDSAEQYIRHNYPELKSVPFVTQHTQPRLEIGYRQMEIQMFFQTCE